MLFGLFAGFAALLGGVILLPLMLVGLVLWLPFMLLKLTLRLVFGLLVLPVFLVIALIGLLAGGLALAVAILAPLIPLLLLAGCAWLLWRLISGEGFRLPA